MSSQLPNIEGMIDNAHEIMRGRGVFKNYPYEDYSPNAGGAYRKEQRAVDFDAKRCSSIYKDNIDQVFGDSVSYNCFIKARII